MLDLDQTLIYCEDNVGDQFTERPGVSEFLVKMKTFFEIVIFTAAKKDYADRIINKLDNNGLISHRLYR